MIYQKNSISNEWVKGFTYCLVLFIASISVFGAVEFGTQFVLKEKFGLSPLTISSITLIFHIPWYLSFLVGSVRDRWNIFGMWDRYVMIGAPICVAIISLVCGAMQFSLPNLAVSLMGLILVGVIYTTVLTARIGVLTKHLGITGRMGTAMCVLLIVVVAIMIGIAGYVYQFYGYTALTVVSAGISLLCMPIVFWTPSLVSEDPKTGCKDDSTISLSPGDRQAIRMPWHVWLVAAIAGLWCFIPGWKTPLLFISTEKWGLSQSEYGNIQAIQNVLIALSSTLHFYFCKRLKLRSILYIGLTTGIFGCIWMLFAHNYSTALFASAWFGASCGIGNAAVNDLMFRAAPQRQEGFSLMLVLASSILFMDISDLAGSFLYRLGGFHLAMGITTVIPVGLVAAVAFLPQSLINSSERSWFVIERSQINAE